MKKNNVTGYANPYSSSERKLKDMNLREKGIFFMHLRDGFYRNESKNAWHCSLYNETAPIHKVMVFEDMTGKSNYWGWFDNETQDYQMIWPNKMLTEMCFPYGSKVEEENGRGKMTCLNIEFLEIIRE